MASTSSSPPLLFFPRLNHHSRNLLPLYPSPPTASSPPASNNQELLRPCSTSNGFDTNVIMILSVLLCALICSIGLNTLIRCVVSCSSFVAETESNINDQQQHNLATRARVANTGIKKKALKTFPTVNYSPDLKFPGLYTECVICLSEFVAGERLKLLPKCNHGFHVRCIDQWLSSHSSCPTCRNCLIETCEKIVGCSSSSSQPAAAAALLPPGSVVINMAPLGREDFVRNSIGNS